MNELKRILQNSLDADTSIVVSFANVLPKTTVRIHDSRTMILYGMGTKDERGFAVTIAVDNSLKQGKKIHDDMLELVDGFSGFVNKRSVVYVKDYGVDIESMVTDLISILRKAATDVKFSVTRVDAGSNS